MGRRKVAPTDVTQDALDVLGGLIRERRAEWGLTAKELGHRTGLSRTTIAAIEHGSAAPSIGNVLNVMVMLDLPLFGTDDPDELARSRAITRERLGFLPKLVRRRDGGDEDGPGF